MIRWLAIFLTAITLAFGPAVPVIAALCEPPAVSNDPCGPSCCCPDESQCPCVQSAPEPRELPPATPRPTGDVRPVLLPLPTPGFELVADAARSAAFASFPREPAVSAVRVQVRLCRWHT